ncbi:hypothetical protein BBP40_002854 [Aspergillus hancockii]|nr:hypothetical protein BBP40_002854 [Aspergillus hancockii]
MMDDPFDGSFSRAIMCPAIILTLSIPHIHHVFQHLSPKQRDSLTTGYEDKDGLATEKSEKGCSDKVQRAVLPIIAVVGVLAALFLSLDAYGTARVIQQLLQFSAWVMVLLQECVLVSRSFPQDRYNLGVWSAVSALLLSIVGFFFDGLWSGPTPSRSNIALAAVKLTAGIILSVINVTLSRRPEVYFGIGLGGSLFVSSWLESLLQWIETMDLELPIREQLSAAIFSKALRIKDVVSVGSHDQTASTSSSSECSDNEDDDDQDGPPRTKQSMTNLLGVDARTIASFAKYSHTLLDSVIQFILAIAFLVNLLGWVPVLWACIVPAILLPLNYYSAQKYSKAEEALMAASDRRMALLSEMLQGIRQIKFSAQEDQWNSKVQKLRFNEIKKQEKVFHFDLILIAVWTSGPLCMSLISLATYFLVNKTLSPSVAFTALSIFERLHTTLGMFPDTVSELIDAMVSARRIEQYLDLPEHYNYHKEGEAIAFLRTTLAWPSDNVAEENDVFKLRDLNMQFPRGELTVISGPAGAGKSLLLLAIIGEAELCHGQMLFPQEHLPLADDASNNEWEIDSSIAFVSQNPWIENGTVRENILLGHSLNPERYRDVLHACCLEDDLETMQDGDQTDLGANGVNLSGGQKWRVALARALYSRAGVLVLDDIFSAVDARVGRHLFERALTGSLAEGRTRIVATHHTALCWSEMKYYVLLENGRVSFAGKPENYCPDLSPSNTGSIQLADHVDSVAQQDHLPAPTSRIQKSSRQDPSEEDIKGKAFYEAETRATGAVKLSMYSIYLKACGGYRYWVPILLTFGVTLVTELAIPYWVSIWTRDLGSVQPTTLMNIQSTPYGFTERLGQQSLPQSSGKSLWFYLGIYLGLFLTSTLVKLLRFKLIFMASIRASLAMFEMFLLRILQVPLSFLDTTPVGQILNRFSADFSALDSDLALDLPNMLYNVLMILSVIIAALFVSPLMVGFGFITLLLSGSPIFEQFGSILDGLVTIRAFGKVDQYMHRMYDTIDAHCQAFWHLRLFNCWMMFRLNMVGAAYVTVTAALIATLGGVDASVAGFALSFALQMSELITWMLSDYAEVELNFNSVERIIEYTQLETEHQGGREAPAAWPTKGKIEINDLAVGYARDSPPVLQGLSFAINPTEHIGIVGRTGSGKSSLTLALLRFLEARSGSIHIDGLDISTLRLRDLRSRIAIIPQDPVIFSGTLRSVLDPFDQYTDCELLAALARVHLGPPTDDEQSSDFEHTNEDCNSATLSLSSPISERGKNLSQGQRQLVCLAQALLSRPKVLIMDEATSSIDMSTDALIQRTIRQEFRDSTLMVIAHRLSTVADFDRILVLGEGRIAEFDTPAALLRNEGGPFWALVDRSGERENLRRIILECERQ